MRIGVTGSGGLLGRTLVPLWRAAGADVAAWTRADCDVTDAGAVRAAVQAFAPDVIVHAAAWTDVDGAERDAAGAMRTNRDGTAVVAAAAAASRASLVYLSTDYVFDGAARAPIGPETPPRPLGAYARSKAAGEAAVRDSNAEWMIVRAGWMYGVGGRNFVDTMRRLAAEGRAVDVVDDQTGAPTSSRLVAEAVWGLIAAGARRIWHVAAAGETSWHGVARAVYDAAGADPLRVRAISSSQLDRPAPRPAYSVLDCRATARALEAALPAWDDQVRAYVRTGELAPCDLMRAAA